jgi:hypothetical protein
MGTGDSGSGEQGTAGSGMSGIGGSATSASSGGTGGSGGSGGTAAGLGGTGGTGGGDDMGLFVPDVPNTYDGSVLEPGMEIIAHGVREGSLGYEWLVAVQSTGTDILCVIDVASTFFDDEGTEIASGFAVLETAPYRGISGEGSLTSCLGPGEIGMGVDGLGLSELDDVNDIASVTHSFGALIIEDAVPTDDLVVTGVQVVLDEFGRNQFVGQFHNDSDAAVETPSVSVFGVNAAGRPLVEAGAIDLVTIPAGGTWSFTTGAFEESVDSFVAFPSASDP